MTDASKKAGAYKDAGVDIEAAAQLVENIKPHINKTHRSGVVSGIGGFGAFFSRIRPREPPDYWTNWPRVFKMPTG